MADAPKFNLRNPAVKRIMQEIKEMKQDTSGDFLAEALETDIFEWHFVIRGPPDTEFEGGIFHGRILLPAEYPFKPPSFMMLTPNGRFETNMKICLSISSHHPEHWQPSWSVRTALTALIAFMPSPGAGALGALDFAKEERRALAARSRVDPPRFGSADRQRLIDEMHNRMLNLTLTSSSSSTAATAAAAVAAPKEVQMAVEQTTSISNSGGGGGGAVAGSGVQELCHGAAAPGSSGDAPMATVAVTAAAASAAERQSSGEPSTTVVGDAGGATGATATTGAAAPGISSSSSGSDAGKVGGGGGGSSSNSDLSGVASTVLRPAVTVTAVSDRPSAEFRPQAVASPAAGTGITRSSTAVTAPAAAAAAMPDAAAAAAAAAATSTDHMLTALMWALYFGIGAILLRKVMGVIGFDLNELLQ